MHLHDVAIPKHFTTFTIPRAVHEIHTLTHHITMTLCAKPACRNYDRNRSKQLHNEDETGANLQNAKREMSAYRANCAFCIANDAIHIPLDVPTDNNFSSQFSINGHGQKTWACKMQNTKNKIY